MCIKSYHFIEPMFFSLNKSVLSLKSLYSTTVSTCKLGFYMLYNTFFLGFCTRCNSDNIPGMQRNILALFCRKPTEVWNSQGQTLKCSNRKSRPANWVCWLFSFKHVYHFLSLKVQITNKGFLFVSKTACPEQFVDNSHQISK